MGIIVIIISFFIFILQVNLNWLLVQKTQEEVAFLWAFVASAGMLIGLILLIFWDRLQKRQVREMLLGLEKAAHDLKAPLISLGIFAEKNQGKVPDDEQRLDWLWVYKQIEWLKHIVQQTLDYRLLRLGRIQSQNQKVRIKSVVEDVASVLAVLYSDLPERLNIDGGDEEILTDPVIIKRIVFNLLANAVRYTSGNIEIAWRVHGSRMLRVIVADEGPGIVSNMSFQGHGLGLKITYGLLRACSSQLVRVPTEKGTTWQFDLPLAESSSQTNWKRRRWNIVLVEDDPIYAQLFRERVKEFADVQYFSRVEKVIDYFQSPGSACDLLLVDNHLKKMKGVDLVPLLRKQGVTLPRVALITSQESFDSMNSNLPPGLRAFPKPLTSNDLELMFDQLLA